MAIIKTVEGKTPRWGKNCFIAENAVLTGDCILGDDCSIWYSAVLRSDVDAIRCGNRVNVQDCACIHQTGTMPCILEDDVSVGHGAIVHGATVRKGALIGMNATVLDKADIGEGAIIAAGAVVTHGTKVPAHDLGGYSSQKGESLHSRPSRGVCQTLFRIHQRLVSEGR